MDRILGVASAVLSISFIWPQVWRSLRHNTTHGISPFGLVQGLFGGTLWLAYGVSEGLVPVFIANASFLTAQSLIILVACRNGHIAGRVLAMAYPMVLVVLVVSLFSPPGAVGPAAVVISGSGIVPQFIHVLRTENLHGISIVSYLLTITTCTSWLLYGFAISDLMISAQNFVSIPALIYITWKAWRWRVHAANPEIPVPATP
jgi:uncharacterized protein with PQ loop repeat